MFTRKGMPAAFALLCVAAAGLAQTPGTLPPRPDNEAYRDEVRTTYRTVHEVQYKQVQETIYEPTTQTVMKEEKYTVQTPTYVTVNRVVHETVCKPVTETVVKEHRAMCTRKVEETCYREVVNTVCRPVCRPVCRKECFSVCKPIIETQFREECHTEMREVTETGFKNVKRTVKEPKCVTKTVCHTVPETTCETVDVKGCLKLERVPKFESCFDPCTCCTVQKQCGTVLKLVRTPDRKESHQVTRSIKISEQVQETVYERKVVNETQEVEHKCRKAVPVTIRVPVKIRRVAQGAYVDPSSLVGDAATQAKNGSDVVGGGPAVLAPGSATYDADAPGRVFVEGAVVFRDVTTSVTEVVPVTEVRRVPYTVTRDVPYEHVTKVSEKVTKMVPTTVEKTVPTLTCRMVTEEKTRLVPTQVTCMKPKVVTKCVATPVCKTVPCLETVRVPCNNGCNGSGCSSPLCSNAGCGAKSAPCDCGSKCGPTCSGAKCGVDACGPKCGCSIGGGMRNVLNDPCRPKPIRDFFGKVCNRLAFDPCPAAHCPDACAPCK